MLSSTFIYAVALTLSLSTAIPIQSKRADFLRETDPWRLKNIEVFESNSDSKPSSISFDISDSNAGLQFNTTCSYTVPANASDSQELENSGSFRPCGVNFVNFKYSGDNIEIQRYYKDPA